MRLDSRKGILSLKSTWSILNSELKVCILLPLQRNNKVCKTNTHTYTHTYAHTLGQYKCLFHYSFTPRNLKFMSAIFPYLMNGKVLKELLKLLLIQFKKFSSFSSCSDSYISLFPSFFPVGDYRKS